ncbi:MAG TPA: aldolase/citrate lyase family protein [Planctomycetaceae bacterium]|nr:aldolase/citrate lyase family protein [Planctomycetaceae bacterium]
MTPITTQQGALLLTLAEISDLVSHSHDAAETLSNIVQLIQQRFRTDVCSVYLLEPERGELVLGATVGLRPECVGKVRMSLHEGLTGLVAEQLAPVVLDDAPRHPRFKYFPEAGEDAYQSFLGAPLIERGLLQGVLVVQTVERRQFTPDEIRMLTTVGSQLAPLVSEAQWLQQANDAVCPRPAVSCHDPVVLQGIPLSGGVAEGTAYLLQGLEELYANTALHVGSDVVRERERLEAALDQARRELARLATRISDMLGEEHGVILQGQLMILQDRKIEHDLTSLVDGGQSAERALRQTHDKYAAVFEKITNKYFQERIYDMRDVFRRVLWHLQPGRTVDHGGDERLVLVAAEASVMDLFSIEPERLAAVLVENGGPQSHAAILARSLGVPMVGGIRASDAGLEPGQRIVVDGTSGQIVVNAPPGAAVNVATATPSASTRCESRPGGREVLRVPRIEANLNLPYEVESAVARGAAGVGLFRSEFVFLARRSLPTEEEQVGIYQRILERLQGRPASIRTFDLRPGKLLHWSRAGSTEESRLDWRLVLDSPPLQKLFRDQVRAILRAATAGPARIVVPFVNSTEQLQFVVETLERARDELHRDGWDFSRQVPLGVMIETAVAVQLAGDWAKSVDFLALGTNDLVASALGLDRDDVSTRRLNDPLQPGVLRLIDAVITAGHAAGKPVTVCGEMAGDPYAASALTVLGVDALSVAVPQLTSIRTHVDQLAQHGLCLERKELIEARRGSELRELLGAPRG